MVTMYLRLFNSNKVEKGFRSTGVSCKAIRDASGALRWSPIQVLK